MKKLYVLATALCAFSASMVGVGAGAAQATTSTTESDFPGKENKLSLYDDIKYKDNFTVINDLKVNNLTESPYRFNDKTSSFVNKTSRFIMVYDDSFLQDTHFCLKPHSHYADLHVIGFNDKISSLQVLSQSSASCGDIPQVGAANTSN